MAKNITLAITKELGEQMDLFPEVIWSAVVRQGIMSYIAQRKLKMNIGAPLEDLEDIEK